MADPEFSGYEDYSKVADSYDSIRITFGLDILLGTLAKYAKDKPLSSLHVLEAACGTGNFTRELCKYVGHITAVDNSDDMLARTKEKLGGVSNVTTKNVDLLKPLPFESGKFDAVMMIYVTHHLDVVKEDGTNTGENLRKVAKESSRVLKKGAPLIIVTNSLTQFIKSIWYFNFACEKGFSDVIIPHHNRYLPLDTVAMICEKSGFQVGPRMVSLSEKFISSAAYYNLNNVLKQEYRRDDSSWRDIESHKRFPQFLEALKEAIEKEEMDEWVKKADDVWSREGMSTFLTFYNQ